MKREFEQRSRCQFPGDLTEEKRWQEAHHQCEERFRFLAESIPHFVWSTQADGMIDYVNQRTLDYMGVPREQIEGWAWISILHPDDRQRTVEACRRALTEGSKYCIEYRFRRADGQYRWFLGHGLPYRDREGRITRWLGTCTDIHDRKCAEEKLKDLNETLEQRVAERTAEAQRLTAQLRRLVAELSQVGQRERRRLAMALHENLQQLLVAAKLEVAHMQRIATDAGLRASVQQVVRILDDCLAESHSVTVQLSPPVLYDGGLVPALEWLGRQMQREHDLMVIIEADRQAEPVDEGVRVLLFQAVHELLSNIVQHAGVKRARLEIVRPGDNRVQIVVQDEGEGFDLAVLEARMADEDAFGLFAIRERLQLIGGRIQLESLLGKGTCVTLVAPLTST